jgi:hypothetical protein
MVNPTETQTSPAKVGPQDGILRWGTPTSITAYEAGLKKSGVVTFPGVPGTVWARYESVAMVRVPAFHTAPISGQDAGQVLRSGRAAVISFLLEPDEKHPANAWHYVCRDRSYALEKLSKEGRRDARRAQRSLRIEPLDWASLLAHGFVAYNDTRTRLGLSDGSIANFRKRFETFSSCPGHYAVGAWKGETLAAFMTLIVIDNWVTMEGVFSASAERDQCPNNGLAHYVLDHFLVKEGVEIVSYGTSSIQETSQKSGLHAYKTRVGFKAEAVHRAFVLHPLLKPLMNRGTLWSLKAALRFMPGDRRLLKIIGALGAMGLGEKPLLEMNDTV